MSHGNDHEPWILHVNEVIGKGPKRKASDAFRHFRVNPDGTGTRPFRDPV